MHSTRDGLSNPPAAGRCEAVGSSNGRATHHYLPSPLHPVEAGGWEWAARAYEQA